MTTQLDVAVVIGRFQPFHNGHLALIREALRVAPRVVVVVGSANALRSPRNPWTHEERGAMIRGALSGEERARVDLVPMRDYFDEPRWRRNLVKRVSALAGEGARVGVVGHFKDATSEYLKGFDDWRLVRVPLLGDVHATGLREAYFAMGSAAVATTLGAQVPEATLAWLVDFEGTTEFQSLRAEQHALVAYRKAWSAAPFPPVFVTVDAVVTCLDHVLLIQRGKAPGKGAWAVPGGFLDLGETLLQGALRELEEETGLRLPAPAVAPLASHVFDHPQRSQRGRTISHGYHFALEEAQLPSLAAADDAAALAWVPLAQLPSIEERFFDDHFHLLDTFLHILDD